jgi:hypothetical protein
MSGSISLFPLYVLTASCSVESTGKLNILFLKEGNSLRLLDNRTLRRIFELK